MTKNTKKLPTYVVRPCPWSTRGWAIFNTVTKKFEEGGFFSKDRAQDYIYREYAK